MPAISEATRSAMLAARAHSGTTMRRWREGPAFRAAAAAFADCDDAPERAVVCAERLLAEDSWIAALLAPLVEALAVEPLFEPALKFHRDARRTGLVLFDCPTASLAASVSSAAAMAALPPPQTIVFSGRTAVTRVVKAGGAQLWRWTAERSGIARFADARLLRDGEILRSDGTTQAQWICEAATDVVTLGVTLRAGAAPLMREHDVATGALVRVADADDRPSRTAMLLRFLRVAGKAEAATCFAEATRAADFHLRWAAMREWLALDAACAAERLAEMAVADPSNEVRVAAARMLPTVAARLAEARCPA